MPYSRYLDLHFCDNFSGTATFANDVDPQQNHQVGKGVAYRLDTVLPLSIHRNVVIDTLRDKIVWVCQADNDGGKIRINAHGDGCTIYSNTSNKVSMEQLAKFLRKNGLTEGNMGNPGLRTINLGICDSAKGTDVNGWMIKKLADLLDLPGVTFTGADGRTKMGADGVLRVNNPTLPNPGPGYVIPAKRFEPFKSSAKKNYYTRGR